MLTLPISGFVGLIRQQVLLLVKFSLWSFEVMNAGFGLVHVGCFSILSFLDGS